MVVDFKQISWANPVLNPFLDSEGRTEVVWGITEIVKELESGSCVGHNRDC